MCHLAQPQQGAQTLILSVVAGGDDQMSVAGGENLVGCQVWMRVAHPNRNTTRCHVVHRLVAHDRHCAIQQGHIDMLAFARRAALVQRGKDRRGCVHPRKDIGDRQARFLRLSPLWTSAAQIL